MGRRGYIRDLVHNIQPAELDEIEQLIDEYEEGDGSAHA